MSTETAIVLASDRLASALAIEKGHMIATIKAQCFKSVHPDRVSDTQLAAYIQVAQSLIAQAPNFNPLLTGFLYAFPSKNGGIEPIIGPDGIFALLASHKSIKGWKAKFETIDGELACTATILHDRLGEITKTCFLTEWEVESNPNWKARPRHMLEIRTLKHAARQIIHGIPLDSDELALAEKHKGFENAISVSADEAAPVPAPERPKLPARRGSARAAAESAQPVADAKADPTPAPAEAAQSSSPAPAQAEPVREVTQPAAGSTPPPAAEKKDDAPPAAPKPPPISEGIDIDGFFGAAWPLDLVIEIQEVKQLALTPQKTPVAVFTGHVQGQVAEQILQFVTIEGVGVDGSGKPKLVGDTLTAGKKVAANVYARLRAGRTDVAPVLWAAKLAQSEEF